MKRTLLLFTSHLLLLASLYAQTSNVQTVKAWTRTHVMGLPGGTLLDPTGSIADALRLETAKASIEQSSNLVAAANAGMSNALARLYAVTNKVSEFTGRIYLAADMDDDPGYSNVWSAVVSESVETNGTLHYYCAYSRSLASPPRTRWAFETAAGTFLWANGVVATNNVTTNVLGLACYDIAVVKPAGVGNVVLRTNKFMKFGAVGYPLDIPDAGICVISGGVTNTAFTGSVAYTNGSIETVETYLAGTLYTVATNEVAQ